jgi:AcrR family transcriptional regulator
MNEIAEAGGLARATLYRHFESRDDLVHAIQAQAVAAGAEALAAVDLDEGSAARALRRAIRALVGVGDRYRVLARETAVNPSALQRQPDVAGELLRLVERGQRDGELRDDLPPSWILPALASLLVLALRAMADERVSADQAAEHVASTLLDGVARSAPVRG